MCSSISWFKNFHWGGYSYISYIGLGLLKRKKASSMEHAAVKVARTKIAKPQLIFKELGADAFFLFVTKIFMYPICWKCLPSGSKIINIDCGFSMMEMLRNCLFDAITLVQWIWIRSIFYLVFLKFSLIVIISMSFTERTLWLLMSGPQLIGWKLMFEEL